MSKKETLKPGTKEAIRDGCTCPILDNHHGRGRWGDGEKYGWWMTESCPLHGPAIKRANKNKGAQND